MKKLLLFALLITFISCKKEEVTQKITITLKSSNPTGDKRLKMWIGTNFTSNDYIIGNKSYEINVTENKYDCLVEYLSNGNYNDSLIVKGLNTDTSFLLENKKRYQFVIK